MATEGTNLHTASAMSLNIHSNTSTLNTSQDLNTSRNSPVVMDCDGVQQQATDRNISRFLRDSLSRDSLAIMDGDGVQQQAIDRNTIADQDPAITSGLSLGLLRVYVMLILHKHLDPGPLLTKLKLLYLGMMFNAFLSIFALLVSTRVP